MNCGIGMKNSWITSASSRELCSSIFTQPPQRNQGTTLLIATIFHELQLYIEDDSEQPVPADRVPEQVRILHSAYGLHRSVRQQDPESKHAVDQGGEARVTPMSIGRERASHRKNVVRLHGF